MFYIFYVNRINKKMKSNWINFKNNFRLKFSGILKSSQFLNEVNEAFYDRMVGHHKVIHWRDGKPVYGTFFLPGYSKPKANHQAGRIISSMQNRTIPYMVDLAVTDKCNCNCDFCSFKSMRDKKKIMSLEEIKSVIFQCQELGVSIINFVGGEPLMRKDILEIIKSVNKDKSSTLMFTNGWLLEEYAYALKAAGLDSVNVALDSFIPEKHDSIKKLNGSFQRAIRGIEKAKKAGLTVGISCAVSKESLRDKSIIKFIEFGKKLKVHEILFWDLIPTGGLADRKDLLGKENWTEDLIKLASFYNKKNDYPGIFTYAYNRSPQSIGCSGGTNYFYITPYGDICPCDFNPLVLGNVLKKPLNLIWDEISRSQECFKTSWKGCKMQDPEYRKKFKIGFEKEAKSKKVGFSK